MTAAATGTFTVTAESQSGNDVPHRAYRGRRLHPRLHTDGDGGCKAGRQLVTRDHG